MATGRRTVWIADDSRLDADRACAILAQDYDVSVFNDGSAVLERIAAGRPPDVLVLDWMMPGISGLEVTRFLRAQPPPRARVAILLLTALRASDQIAAGLGAGANDYLSKPYAEEELRARVAALIQSQHLLERVEAAEDMVRRLLVQTPDALIVVDAHGKISYVNPEAEGLIGLPVVALVGRPLTEVVPGLQVMQLADRVSPVVGLPDVEIGAQVFAPTVRFLSSDFAASTSIALRNVTERRRIESRRLDFYSIIAHDLRSPLSSVLLRTDLILRGGRGDVPPALTADIRKIDQNMRSMVSLINDFLDLARLEGGGYRLDAEELDLAALVAATVDDIRPLAEESGIRIDTDLPATGELLLAGDRRRLIQVITNLLSNAIKFTPADGRVGVFVCRRGAEFELRVTDTGRGIPADVLPLLFQRYTRAPEGRSPVAGTGLGLMIVREIVEAHRGRVEAQSQPGAGATFTVRLPVNAAGWASTHGKVLVVDDHEDVRDSLLFVLEKAGYTVDTAVNGRDALNKLSEGPTPRLVVLDVSMPVMSGPELVEAMKRDDRLSRVPVCIMSGNLAALGFAPPGALVLQKPIQVDRLLDYLGKLAAGPVKAAS